MKEFSKSQFKTLSEFCNMLAAGWFTGGIITALFTKIELIEKVQFVIIGMIGSAIYLYFALNFSKD